jgi:heme-degrading monooxygenase HmoA
MSETGVADILATPGNEGVLLLRRELGEHTRFSTVSLWRSESAIRAFSGTEGEQARLEPRDAEFLVDHEPIAEHHQVALAGLRATEGSLWYPGGR